MHWGLGPVFIYECIANARRWQIYAARSFGVAALLAGMATIAWANVGILSGNSARGYAKLGEYYYYALIGVELMLVMLAAPAATAGAICLDRSRGTLTHVLATDLSDREIVLGKLAARLLPVLGLVACTLPVMALGSLLGGIDPMMVTAAFAVIVAVAVLGCSLALVLSVWARKPHEVIVVVYTFWAVVILAYPVMWFLARVRLVVGPPRWLLLADPFYLAFAPYLAPGWVDASDFLGFLAAALGASGALVLLAVWRMRPVSSRGLAEVRNAKVLGLIGRITRWLTGPSLDGNPVLWRECRRGRPSGWVTALVVALGGTLTIACVVGAYSSWKHGIAPGPPAGAGVIAGVFAAVLQVIFGLLILSALAPMSLSEERQRGSLDVLVVTPLLTRSIVLGKWLGPFRLVPFLTIGPGLMMLALATAHSNARVVPAPGLAGLYREMPLGYRLFGAALMVTTILAHGAAITSVGLALGAWIKRPSRAIAMSVCAFVLVAVAWPIVAYVVFAGPVRSAEGLAALSPITAVTLFADLLMTRLDRSTHLLWWVTFWNVMVAYCALGLLWLTIRSFDACLGRAPDRIGRSPLMANILVFWAGAIGVVCAAGAITVWVEGIIPQSLSFEKFVVLFGGVSVAMIGVLMLTVVAIFDTPAERSTASAAVLARWWRTFRLALILALGPGLLALALATVRTIDEGMPVPPLPTTFPALRPATLGYRLIGVSLLVATILAHGAAMTAVGVFLSLWTKRRGRAFAIGVGLFLFAAFVWPFLLFFGGPAQYGLNLSMMTFLAAAVSLVVPLVTREPQLSGIVEWAMAWVVLLILLTIGVLWRTSRMLNRRSAQLRAHDALVTSGSVIKPRVAHEAFSGN